MSNNQQHNSGLMRGWLAGLAAIALAAGVPAAVDGATIYGDTADREQLFNGTAVDGNAVTLEVGKTSTANMDRRIAILVFDLQSVAQDFQTASLGVYLDSKTSNLDASSFEVDLYGVGFSDDPQTSNTAYYADGASDDAAETKIADSLLTPASATGQFHVASDQALVDFLNTRPETGGRYAFFRLNPASGPFNDRFYSIAAADAAGTTTDPVLNYTVVPEPASAASALIAMSFLGLRRRSRQS